MTRSASIVSLIYFDRPIAELRASLATISWDADAVAILARPNIISVLKRFEDKELDGEAVNAWANLVESREDIEFEPGHQAAVSEAIFDLANPELQGPLVDVLPALLCRLRA